MKMIKSLVLGSAAGLLAMGGAQAADLPVKAKAVEYVRICSLYGAGFYYIPGTDTCIKIGGYIRAEVNYHGGNSDGPFWSGDPGVVDRYVNQYNDLARMALTIDTRDFLRRDDVFLDIAPCEPYKDRVGGCNRRAYKPPDLPDHRETTEGGEEGRNESGWAVPRHLDRLITGLSWGMLRLYRAPLDFPIRLLPMNIG